MRRFFQLFILLALASLQSCIVTKKKYDDILAQKVKTEGELAEKSEQLTTAHNQLKDLTDQLSKLKTDTTSLGEQNRTTTQKLAEQLLFGSGSIEVDTKGVSALQQLAKAIKDQKDIQIMVEGHTDNVPIGKKSSYMQDNWDLSVMRATSITKILTKAGVSANQITASGKGEYSPLVANTSDQNKQKNRRTEIIITPNLDELFKILGTN